MEDHQSWTSRRAGSETSWSGRNLPGIQTLSQAHPAQEGLLVKWGEQRETQDQRKILTLGGGIASLRVQSLVSPIS